MLRREFIYLYLKLNSFGLICYNYIMIQNSLQIRVTQAMWRDMISFQQEAHRQQHLDVDYVFHRLRVLDAFLFVATAQPVCSQLQQFMCSRVIKHVL